MADELENPFIKGVRRERAGRWEFEEFKRRVRPVAMAGAKRTPRLQVIEPYCSFYVDDQDPDRVEIFFGKRYRNKPDGKLLTEHGASIVYSQSSVGGTTATMLFPAHSDEANVLEDRIYLRIGSFSGAQLIDCVEKDLRDLATYHHASSIDGSPTFGEKIRVWWLRTFHPMSVENKQQPAAGWQKANAVVEFTSRTLLIALLRPIAYLVIAVVVLALGLPQLAHLLSK